MPPKDIDQKQLQNWKLVRSFQRYLEQPSIQHHWDNNSSQQDPRRLLKGNDYFSLMLFGMLNPVVNTMRGLCAASHFDNVQDQVCRRAVSLGSFSEGQQVFEPQILQQLFTDLAKSKANQIWGDHRLKDYQRQLMAVDSSLWKALPRMGWALWTSKRRLHQVRLHVKYQLLNQRPNQVSITGARQCERAELKKMLKKGQCYVADRYYSEAHGLFEHLEQAGCDYVLRLGPNSHFKAQQDYELSQEDQQSGVLSDQWGQIGTRSKSCPLRVVTIRTQTGSTIELATNFKPQELSAELIGLIYKYRWQVELFFKWLKCILKCRHWLAHSEQGVASQLYCALIAAILLEAFTGKRPNKRAMEALEFYVMGYIGFEELQKALSRNKAC